MNEMFVLVNATVIPATGTPPFSGAVVVEGDRIAEVTDGAFRHTGDATLIDLGGRALLPGLVDAHVHATAVDADIQSQALRRFESEIAVLAATALTEMLERGFTTVRDAGGADAGLRRAIEEGSLKGPRLLVSGRALSQTGGHGDQRSATEEGGHKASLPRVGQLSIVADGPDEVRRCAREQLRRGADQIKVMASGGVMSPADRLDSVQYSLEELTAAVQAARSVGTYVMAHAVHAERDIELCCRWSPLDRARQPAGRIDSEAHGGQRHIPRADAGHLREASRRGRAARHRCRTPRQTGTGDRRRARKPEHCSRCRRTDRVGIRSARSDAPLPGRGDRDQGPGPRTARRDRRHDANQCRAARSRCPHRHCRGGQESRSRRRRRRCHGVARPHRPGRARRARREGGTDRGQSPWLEPLWCVDRPRVPPESAFERRSVKVRPVRPLPMQREPADDTHDAMNGQAELPLSFRLDGRVALVIGGTGTLGSHMASALAEAGARTVIVGRDRVHAGEVHDRLGAIRARGRVRALRRDRA